MFGGANPPKPSRGDGTGWQSGSTNHSAWLQIMKGVNETDIKTLRLINLTKEDEGHYTCSASNFVGATNHSAWLRILEGSLLVAARASVFVTGLGVLIKI